MKNLIFCFPILFLLFCSISNKNNNSTNQSYNQELMIKMQFEIADMLAIGWGTIYKISNVEKIYGKIPAMDDSLKLAISANVKKISELNPHLLKKNGIYTAGFSKSNKRIEKSAFLPAGTTGFADAEGVIWKLITLEISEKSEILTTTGKALNAKSGAVIVTENGQIYYIEKLVSWPENIFGKTVEVSGVLKSEYFDEKDLQDENGNYRQGMVGEKLSILNVKWKLKGD